MPKLLNFPAISSAMNTRGLSQSQLSSKLDVSRTAVSNWMSGKDFPRPDKLLRLGMLLNLDYDQIVINQPSPDEPVVAFRRKGRHKTRQEHAERAIHMGRLLERLVPYLPFDLITRPATLCAPRNDYAYLQRAALRVRAEIKVEPDGPLRFQDLVGKFSDLHAVIVPVFWGDRTHHGNALHIYLPASMTTWVYLNLDSNAYDFKFWMAHELGHVLAPELREDEGEDFADAFAQALLYPQPCAKRLYAELLSLRGTGQRVNRIKEEAKEFGISPITVNLAIEEYASEHGLNPVDAGKDIYPARTQFNKQTQSISRILFKELPPSATDYIAITQDVFKSPFFDALRRYLREPDAAAGFVETVLQLPLRDAREIAGELR